jgi:pyruvate kinase
MKIVATISPITPVLNDIDMVRINGAFLDFERSYDTIRVYKELGIPCFVDIPNGRKKIRTNKYTDEQIVNWCKKNNIDYIALSYVNSPDDLKYNYRTIAKIETEQGLKNCCDIAKEADKVLIDRRDLATAIGITNLAKAIDKIKIESKKAGTKLMIASEVLFSMIQNVEPTIAEVVQIGSLDCDYIVLAEETAISKNAQYIINTIKQII